MDFNELKNVPFFTHRRNIGLRVRSNRMLINVVDTASLPDLFPSFSRQSSGIVAYERRSFVHFGKFSPQKISWDILFSLILP